jgi:hypothetical protein
MNIFKRISAILLPLFLFIFMPLSAFATDAEAEADFPAEFIFEWIEI